MLIVIATLLILLIIALLFIAHLFDTIDRLRAAPTHPTDERELP